MSHYDWAAEFENAYQAAMARYRAGSRKPTLLFTVDEQEQLARIGASSQEIFDFIEDYCQGSEPAFADVLLVTAVRREFFLREQDGKTSVKRTSMTNLPSKHAAIDDIAWLPRIIAKARAKLRGEMPPDLMFLCGGDRPFLKSVNVSPADFLRVVWAAGLDETRVVNYVKAQMKIR